jgi:serine/threonine-protein kinase RsbW
LTDESKPNIELQIPSRLGYEKVAMDAAADVARLMGFADDRIEDLKTAVAEACINAMEHGNKFDETLSVGIILSKGTDSLEVKVVDTGTKPLGQVTVPDIDKKMHEQEQTRGMGMFLIESLVDEVEWGNTPRSGNFARMVIRLRSAEE